MDMRGFHLPYGALQRLTNSSQPVRKSSIEKRHGSPDRRPYICNDEVGSVPTSQSAKTSPSNDNSTSIGSSGRNKTAILCNILWLQKFNKATITRKESAFSAGF
jgi:hypothetical protein